MGVVSVEYCDTHGDDADEPGCAMERTPKPPHAPG